MAVWDLNIRILEFRLWALNTVLYSLSPSFPSVLLPYFFLLPLSSSPLPSAPLPLSLLLSSPLVILPFFLYSPGQFRQYFWNACCRQTTTLSKTKKTHQCQLRRPLNIDRIRLEPGQWACFSWGGSLKLVLCKNTHSFLWFPNMALKNLMFRS